MSQEKKKSAMPDTLANAGVTQAELDWFNSTVHQFINRGASSIPTPSTPALQTAATESDVMQIPGRFGLQREQMIDLTHAANNFSATTLVGGYGLSLLNGVGRIMEPPRTEFAAYFQHGARIAYNAQSSATSLLRFITTDPAIRTSEISAGYAKASNVFSAASVLHGLGIFIGRFASPGFLKAYSAGSSFNTTALLGTFGAQMGNNSEASESGQRLSQITEALKSQAVAYVPRDEIMKIVKSYVPHITTEERQAKTLSYYLAGTAAIGGLVDGIPGVAKTHKPGMYEQLVKMCGNEAKLKNASRIGGFVNGMGYAMAALIYPALVSDDYHSKERRLSLEKSGQWDTIHENGVKELGIVIAGAMMLGILARRHAKSATTEALANGLWQRLNKFGEIFLGKTDCLAGVAFGTAAVASKAIYDKKFPDNKDLLDDPMQSRRWWAGPRLAVQHDVLKYLEETNPNRKPEEVEKYLRGLMRSVNDSKKVFTQDQINKMSIDEIRNTLENGVYDKVAGSSKESVRVMSSHNGNGNGNGKSRPFWAGAYYASDLHNAMNKKISRGFAAKEKNPGFSYVGDVHKLFDGTFDRGI